MTTLPPAGSRRGVRVDFTKVKRENQPRELQGPVSGQRDITVYLTHGHCLLNARHCAWAWEMAVSKMKSLPLDLPPHVGARQRIRQEGVSAGKGAEQHTEGGLEPPFQTEWLASPWTAQSGILDVGLALLAHAETSGHVLDCLDWQALRDPLTQLCHRRFRDLEAQRKEARSPSSKGKLLAEAEWDWAVQPSPPSPPALGLQAPVEFPMGWGSPSCRHPPPPEWKELNSHLTVGCFWASLP